jgi:cytochrome b561
MSSASPRYGLPAIVLHWAVALGALTAVALALYLDTLELGDTKTLVLATHKSVGLTVLALMTLRLAWRLTHSAPPLPPSTPPWQRRAAGATHGLLYVLMLGLPVTGYVSVAARGRDTVVFGLFKMPDLVPLSRTLANQAETLHTNGQYVLYVLVGLHAAAALYHHYVVRDGLLKRMWPGGSAAQ